MTPLAADSPQVRQINEAMRAWNQGDVVLEEGWFLTAVESALPLTRVADDLQEEGLQAAFEDGLPGLVILSQTCDLVRDCLQRPFVEVAPLVETSEAHFAEVLSGRTPAFALVPALADHRFVADLDRIMTVEKAVVLRWKHVPGCRTDAERREFGRAVARKFSRFAFPDDFVSFMGTLQREVRKRHDKESPAGRALRALREIRVAAAPSWEAPEVSLMFYFVRHAAVEVVEALGWDEWLERWLDLIPEQGRFRREGLIITLADMSAKDYIESVPLEFDYLSRGTQAEAADDRPLA